MNSLPKKVAGSLLAAPLLLFLFQLPEASLDILEKIVSKPLENQPFLSLLILMPYFWVASTLSTSLTFAAVLRQHEGGRPTFAEAFRRVEPKLIRLLAATSLAGVVVMLGLTLILPGIYFMAVYLFVPFIILIDTEMSSAFSVLNRSKKLAERRRWTTIGVTVLLIAAGLIFHLVGEQLGTLVSSFATAGTVTSEIVFFAAKLFLSSVVGATMNVTVSHYFLALVELPATGHDPRSQPNAVGTTR